jgi:hypothetical protein
MADRGVTPSLHEVRCASPRPSHFLALRLSGCTETVRGVEAMQEALVGHR